MAFCPAVSAISGIGWPRGDNRWLSCCWINRATSVEPVNTTPAVERWATSAAPTLPAPGSSCRAPGGTPASRNTRMASAAISGVSSAGLAITALPAASAPETWPTKIDSGKFHGLMQTTVPSGACVWLLKCARASAA